MRDYYLLALLGGLVLLVTALTELMARRSWLAAWLSRKLLHIVAVGACAVVAVWLTDLQPLIYLVVGAEVLLVYAVGRGLLVVDDGSRRSWGIALFPLAYLVLLLCFAQQRWLIALPMGILALSDAAAAIVGRTWAKRYYYLTADRKSWIGSLAFVLVTWGLLLCCWPALLPLQLATPRSWIVGTGLIAVLLATLEAFGTRGLDNVYVPLGAALLLQAVPQRLTDAVVGALLVTALVGVAFGYWAVRRRSLSLDGAVAAVLIATWVVYFVGAVWLVPLLFFFFSAVQLERYHRQPVAAADAKHGRARDAVQVFCNGGVYAALASVAAATHWTPAYLLLAASMAVSTADTWASAIGIARGGTPYDLLRWRPLPVGVSGGVSGAGTLAGLVGAVLMAVLCWTWLPNSFSFIWVLLVVGGAGFGGMLLDSVLGAAFQARYRWADQVTDTALPQSHLVSGYTWMTNDVVNLLSSVLTVALLALLLVIMP